MYFHYHMKHTGRCSRRRKKSLRGHWQGELLSPQTISDNTPSSVLLVNVVIQDHGDDQTGPADHSDRADGDVQRNQKVPQRECVRGSSRFLWSSGRPGFKLHDQQAQATVSFPAPLAPNYEVIEDIGVYKFHLDWKTWSEAKRICEDEGTQLAILDHYQEYAVLREKAMVRLQGHDPYIGVYRNGTQGNWTTVLGKPLDHKDYLGWWPGYPNSEGDCARLRIGIRQGIVNGLCDVKRPFLCEVH